LGIRPKGIHWFLYIKWQFAKKVRKEECHAEKTFADSNHVFYFLIRFSHRSLGPKRSRCPKKDEPSLYERLGGVYNIAAVVDDFIERLYVNGISNANPKIDEARKRVPKAELKFRIAALVCQVTGGPEKYMGRSMKEAHQHLNIAEK
jgi:hypothetical protein